MCSLFWMMKYTGGYNFTVVLHRIIPKLKWYVIFCIDMTDMFSTPAQVIASHLSSSSITFYVMYRFHRICNASYFAHYCLIYETWKNKKSKHYLGMLLLLTMLRHLSSWRRCHKILPFFSDFSSQGIFSDISSMGSLISSAGSLACFYQFSQVLHPQKICWELTFLRHCLPRQRFHAFS